MCVRVCVLCACACGACTTMHVCMRYIFCLTEVELFIIDQDQAINEATEAFCGAETGFEKKLDLCLNIN